MILDASQSTLALADIPTMELPPAPRRAKLTIASAPTTVDGHGVVGRPRLFKRLATAQRVTVISAAPGSGKAHLLRSWIEASALTERVAWVRVGREERSTPGFLLAVVNALRDTAPGSVVVRPVTDSPGVNGWAVVEQLLEDLSSLQEPVWLVITDLHKLDTDDTERQLELLLGEAPQELRFVLSSRRDPQLGLHRLRLAGELTELRAADLRFTLEESRSLFEAAGVQISQAALERLHQRSEGWATGLRLAALALDGHAEPERFVREFAGSERTVADYLFAEVLARQPQQARQLLLRTSILEQVNGELGDLLGGSPGSRRIMQELEESNAFVVSLDTSRSWFRYHSLFRDLLRLELERSEPAVVSELHRAAARWFEDRGDAVEAIHHAQAADDWGYAGRLVADHSPRIALDGRIATLESLLSCFPSSVASADPELSVVLARAKVFAGTISAADGHIEAAERNASRVREERRPRFELSLRLARLMLARRRGDFTSALEEAQPLLAAQEAAAGHVPHEEDVRAYAFLQLGIVELWTSRHEQAEEHLERGLELARAGERPYLEVQCLSYLAVRAGRHSFALARERALAAIEIAQAHGWDADRAAGAALLALGSVDVWQGRFAAAAEWLDRAERSIRPDLEPGTGLMLHAVRGRLHAALGRHEDAAAAYRAAGRLEELVVSPQLMSHPARRLLAQTQMQMGDVEGARATLSKLVDEDGRDSDVARAARARMMLGEGEEQAALDALTPLLDGSLPSNPMLLVEALLLAALAHEWAGESRAAEGVVERALELAEPNGLIWPFVATPVGELLERHPAHSTAHGALLRDILGVIAGSAPTSRSGPLAPLDEHLSESELRVLRYLPTNLSASDIGRELYLSVYTVKTHIRHIYSKLGVHRRADAVERARGHGLLGSALSTR